MVVTSTSGTQLTCGGRLVLRSEGLPDVEYALFDPGEMELFALSPGSTRESCYRTTTIFALSRLASYGIDGALFEAAFDALAGVAGAYARGPEVQKLLPRLSGRELFASPVFEPSSRTYVGTFIDFVSLAADAGVSAGAFQALYLYAAVSELDSEEEVLLSTLPIMRDRRPGERSHKRPTIEGIASLPERVRAMGVRENASRAPALTATDLAALFHAFGEESVLGPERERYLALERGCSERAAPTRGPLADPALWELERQLDSGDATGVLAKLDASDRANGRGPGTAYLRARVALSLGTEAPKLIAERASALSLSMPHFAELELLAAEAWSEAADLRRALPYARDVAEAQHVDPQLRSRAQSLLDRAADAGIVPSILPGVPPTSPAPMRDLQPTIVPSIPPSTPSARPPIEATPIAPSVAATASSSSPSIQPSHAPPRAASGLPVVNYEDEDDPDDTPTNPAFSLRPPHAVPPSERPTAPPTSPAPPSVAPSSAELISQSALTAPPLPPKRDVPSSFPKSARTAVIEERGPSTRPDPRSEPPTVIPVPAAPRIPPAIEALDGDAPLGFGSLRIPPAPASDPQLREAQKQSAARASRIPDAVTQQPPKHARPKIQKTGERGSLGPSRPPSSGKLVASSRRPSPDGTLPPPLPQRARFMKGASQPPLKTDNPPPLLPDTPDARLTPTHSEGPELAEHLVLPEGASPDTPAQLVPLPRTIREARIAFTLLSRELGAEYRQARGTALLCDLRGLEAMQGHLFEAFPDHAIKTEEQLHEVRKHGAFLSEVLARALDARWVDIEAADLGHWAMIVPPNTRVWPFGRVVRLVAKGHKERDLVSYFLELEKRAKK